MPSPDDAYSQGGYSLLLRHRWPTPARGVSWRAVKSNLTYHTCAGAKLYRDALVGRNARGLPARRDDCDACIHAHCSLVPMRHMVMSSQ